MKKILNICYPTITSFESTSNLLAILENYEQCDEWLQTNFIQMEVLNGEKKSGHIQFYNHQIRFEECPFVDYNVINKEIFEVVDVDFIDLLNYALAQDYYIRITVDISKIGVNQLAKPRFNKILVYGCNNDDFYVAGFFHNSKYEFQKCTSNEINEGFAQSNKFTDEEKHKKIEFIKFNSLENFKLDLDFISMCIDDYLNGVNLSLKYKRLNEPEKASSLFGLNIYLYLNGLIFKELKAPIFFIDVRSFHMLMDQKITMKKRIIYLGRKGINILNYDIEYGELIQSALIIRNLILKYNTSNKTDILYKVSKQLDLMKQKEISILEGFNNNIKDYAIRNSGGC